ADDGGSELFRSPLIERLGLAKSCEHDARCLYPFGRNHLHLARGLSLESVNPDRTFQGAPRRLIGFGGRRRKLAPLQNAYNERAATDRAWRSKRNLHEGLRPRVSGVEDQVSEIASTRIGVSFFRTPDPVF